MDGWLVFPAETDKQNPFFEALQKAIGITTGLAGLSPRGLTPFLTGADTTFVERTLAGVFTDPSGENFIANVDKLEEQLKPVIEFLQKAIGQSTDLFGRGIMAALDAASQSTAQAAFLQTLGQGTKDIIFQGITEAFLSSAQFNDLLAPIQQTIRDFT